jgi:hypothetical protein
MGTYHHLPQICKIKDPPSLGNYLQYASVAHHSLHFHWKVLMVTHMNTPANTNKKCCMTYITSTYANSNILKLHDYGFYYMKNNNSNNKTNTMMNTCTYLNKRKHVYTLFYFILTATLDHGVYSTSNRNE